MSFYSLIADEICTSKGQCVLLLGPELSVNQDGVYYKSFFKQLAEDENNLIFQYFENENIFLFQNEPGRDSTVRTIRKFYKDTGDKTLLELIARIKFPLIINVCPDKALNAVLEDKYGMKENKDYFYIYRDIEKVRNKKKIEGINEIPDPNKNLPVIYNIFGDYEDLNSIIFDHQTFYATIQDLMGLDAIPPTIDKFLSTASSFVFLGFNFESWHYHLMCHKLGLGQPLSVKNGFSSLKSTEQSNNVQIVLRNHFKVKLNEDTPTHTIEKLIQELELNCPESLREKIDNDNFEVYVSYAWDENRTDITSILMDIMQNAELSDDNKNLKIIDFIKKSGKNLEEDVDFMELFSQSLDIEDAIDKWYNNLNFIDVKESKINNYSRERLIFLLMDKLREKGIKVIRDKNELTFGDSIDSFMNRIGKGKVRCDGLAGQWSVLVFKDK